jgi:hypothetical protein
MATSGTFYLDAPSLSTASVVYSNAALTTVAANGFYSDGSIVREQLSGVLLPQQTCPACAVPCGSTINANGTQGVYYLNTNLGSSTGAVIVRFNPTAVPEGIKAVYNSTVYNGLSSPTFGWRQGTAGLTTYLGSSSDACSSGIVSGSPYTLNEFQYNGTTFAPLGTTEPVTIAAGQLQLTASAPGNCVMVIPKTAATPSILNLTFVGPCTGAVFSVSVSCPAALPSFDSSTMHATSVLACAGAINQSYYVAHVNGAAGVLGLYDLVFSDANGQFKLAAGFYKTNDAGVNDWYQVDANGVIIAFGTCAVACGGIITGSGTQGVYYVETNLGTATGAVIVKFNPQSIPDGILATYNSVNYNGVSSPLYGWLQGTIGEPTYIGALGDDCGIVAGSPYTLNEFEYNGSAFVSLGTTTSISVGAGQMELTALPPGNTVMVIPKILASPSLLNLEFIGVCGDTGFTIDVTCPAALTSFASSTGNGDSASACSATISPTYYVAHVTGSGGVLGIYDLVFSDANGQFKLGSGYYKTTAAGANNWYQVDFNGVIIAFGTCP